MKYKVWIQIEKVDDDEHDNENVTGPVELASCHTLPEALAIVEKVSTIVGLMGS